MNAKDAIKSVLNSNMWILKTLLGDLSDADLFVRPTPGANHTAWQLGHLISSEVSLVAGIGGVTAKLPEGFAEKHSNATKDSDSPAGFLKKQEYLDLYDQVRAATLAALDKLPESELGQLNTASSKEYAPLVGDVYLTVGTHMMMHGGQTTVVRRKLGKPVLF